MAEEMREFDAEEEDTQRGKYLTFYLGGEEYGIEISLVTEIIGIQPVTEVPEVPDYIKGIINLRGKIIPVMDVRLRFKKPFLDYNDRTCVIVIESRQIMLGLIVDGVTEVLEISDENIVPPPEIKSSQNKYIKGIGKAGGAVKLLLDCDKIFNEEDEEKLANL